jgi:hypothetical protein
LLLQSKDGITKKKWVSHLRLIVLRIFLGFLFDCMSLQIIGNQMTAEKSEKQKIPFYFASKVPGIHLQRRAVDESGSIDTQLQTTNSRHQRAWITPL